MAVEAGLRQELAANEEYIQCIRDPQLMGVLILASCAMVLSCCCSRADPIGADERQIAATAAGERKSPHLSKADVQNERDGELSPSSPHNT